MRNPRERYVKLVYSIWWRFAKRIRTFQILLAPSFIGPPPPPVLLARLASNSFCRISLRSSRFFRASSNFAVPLGFSSRGSNSESFQLHVFRLCNAVACVSVLVLGRAAGCDDCSDAPSVGTQGSDGEANSASWKCIRTTSNLIHIQDVQWETIARKGG